MYVFECEDTPDGIFTAIYDAYTSHLGHENIRLSCQNDSAHELFCTSRTIFTDVHKSQAVRRTLQKHFSPSDYITLCEAALSIDSLPNLPIDKAEAIYKTVVLGLLHAPEETELARHAAEPHVCKVFALSRHTRTETIKDSYKKNPDCRQIFDNQDDTAILPIRVHEKTTVAHFDSSAR